MASQNTHSFTASGFGGIEETFQGELDAVQAIYFPLQLDSYSSSDSDGKSSDDDRNGDSDTLFQKPTTLTQNSHESLHQNPDTCDSASEDSDKCICTFLTASSQCSLGPNERACSTLFTETTVSEMRSQGLELTSFLLDLLIIGRLDGYTKERHRMKRFPSQFFVCGHQVRRTFLFLHCISKEDSRI